MEIELDDRLRSLIGNVARKKGFQKFTIDTEPGSARGDNYLGTITKVKVSDAQNDKSLDLIMKSASSNDDFRKVVPIKNAFSREIYFYSKIIPTYNALLKEYGLDELNEFPTMWSSDLELIPEVLIMDDMKAKGYVMKNRTEPLDIHHVTMVMKVYGKFHGLYFALKEIHPEICAELTEAMEESFFNAFVDSELTSASIIKTNEKVFKALLPEDIEARKRFEEYTKDTINKILKVLEPTAAGRFAVFNHGDSWVNNMLFYYENKESLTPSELCLLDFQLARIGSPALDLSYFIFTCTDRQLREKHYDELMQIYHDSMRDLLNAFSLKVENYLTINELHEQMRRFSLFGIHMTIAVTHLMLSDQEEIPDFENMNFSDDLENSMKTFHFVSKNEGRYMERIRGVILDCIDKGYL